MNYYNIHTADLEQYIVKPGDSLYMIAKKYGVTVDELKIANHLVSNMIYPNQILFIPKNKCKVNSFTNPKDDSINNLINKYSLKLDEISNYKFNEHPRDYNYYIVQPQDNLESILYNFELTPTEFLKLNENKLIIPGEKIIIRK